MRIMAYMALWYYETPILGHDMISTTSKDKNIQIRSIICHKIYRYDLFAKICAYEITLQEQNN